MHPINATTEAVRELISTTAEMLGEKHFARKDGSAPILKGVENRTSQAALEILGSVEFVEVTEKINKAARDPEGLCRYYRFNMPKGVTAIQGVMTLGELSDEQLAGLKAVRSEHQDDDGSNNRVDFISDAIEATTVNFGHVIVGPHEGQQVVWTWHPGDVAIFMDNRDCTVKLQG